MEDSLREVRRSVEREVEQLERRLRLLREALKTMRLITGGTLPTRRRSTGKRRAPANKNTGLAKTVLDFVKAHPGAKVAALHAALPTVKKQQLYNTVYWLRKTKRLKRTQSLRLPTTTRKAT